MTYDWLGEALKFKICLAFFGLVLYTIVIERGVCFRTALGESLCGSLLCCSLLIFLYYIHPTKEVPP